MENVFICQSVLIYGTLVNYQKCFQQLMVVAEFFTKKSFLILHSFGYTGQNGDVEIKACKIKTTVSVSGSSYTKLYLIKRLIKLNTCINEKNSAVNSKIKMYSLSMY